MFRIKKPVAVCVWGLFTWGAVVAQAPPSSPNATAAPPRCVPCDDAKTNPPPNRHPLVEFIWRIAATDNLHDPVRLFTKTLGVEGFSGPRALPWGVTTGTGPGASWPTGLRSAFYSRRNPKDIQNTGDRYLSFSIDITQTCVTLQDVRATFGTVYWSSPIPVIAPSPASSAEGIPPKKRDHDFWGLDFRLPNLFQGNPESIVRFEFAYETCARSVALHHPYPLGTFSYLEKEISK